MKSKILAIMCHEIIDNINECLEILESPSIDRREDLCKDWQIKIMDMYQIIEGRER